MGITNVAVVGAGLMGTGIAQVVAVAGYKVFLNDISQEILEKSKRTISKQLGKSVAKGRLTEEAAKCALDSIVFSTDLEAVVKNADYVIEAVPEKLDLKKEILSRVDKIAKETAIIASNTSEMSIESLGEAVNRRDKFIGTHWFFPPHVMKLIEVVVAPLTSPDTVSATLDFSKKIGKETVVCKDCPGFITSRAISALISECMKIYEEGIASFEDIDKAMRLGFNHPIGPFQLTDMSGVDVVYHSISSLQKAYPGDRFKPGDRMSQLIKEGKLGQKTGKGYYDYTEKK